MWCVELYTVYTYTLYIPVYVGLIPSLGHFSPLEGCGKCLREVDVEIFLTSKYTQWAFGAEVTSY